MIPGTQGAIYGAVYFTFAAFVICTLLGFPMLGALRKLQLRQHAYEDAPQSHQVKSGTPTMGGLLFLIALILLDIYGRIVFHADDRLMTPLVFLAVACGFIGFLDDYLSIVRGRNLGLRARTKYLATALVAIVFLRWIDASTVIFPRDTLLHAGTFVLIAPHWLWLVLGILAITGTIHAVNLTDGLDGLATGSIISPLLVLMVVAVQAGMTGAILTLCVTVGASLAFLIFNRHPAKMFMGDTGSLTLGAVLSGAAIATGEMLLLLLIGGLFVAEALSVIIQVAYFKRTKKRIFRMSPLHHHFELGGWSETKVTTRFWAVSALLSLAGLAVVR